MQIDFNNRMRMLFSLSNLHFTYFSFAVTLQISADDSQEDLGEHVGSWFFSWGFDFFEVMLN